MSSFTCRFCQTELKHTFTDLGVSPLANSYIQEDALHRMEPFYPLHVYVCESCYLVQLPEFETPEHIFSDYAYFSSFSESWLKHCKKYAESMISRFGFNESSQVIEIASNDGYLLQYFKEIGVPVLGIEPAENVAKTAQDKGIPTTVKFFGVQTATELAKEYQTDLLIGNNVLAHVPDLNDFVKGMGIILKPQGIITMEFPHLLQLYDKNQFDTIYHEHFSYFSLGTINKVFDTHGLHIFDVEELPTHGGSLRIYACHKNDSSKSTGQRVVELLEREKGCNLDNMDFYLSFNEKVKEIKRNILDFMIKTKREGKSVVGYGAPAKGNTLLNYCGIGNDFIDYTVDMNPYKQGCYLPGVHIPIHAPEKIKITKPDYVVILPWNIKEEIMQQMSGIREWGGKFVVFIPEVEIL